VVVNSPIRLLCWTRTRRL